MVFGKMFPYALAHARPGTLVHMKLSKMEDDTLMMKGIDPVEVD